MIRTERRIIVKECEAPTCRATIRWVVPSKPGLDGYWANHDSGKKHLCPSFDADKYYDNKTPPLRKSTIEARLVLIERQLVEIMRIISK